MVIVSPLWSVSSTPGVDFPVDKVGKACGWCLLCPQTVDKGGKQTSYDEAESGFDLVLGD